MIQSVSIGFTTNGTVYLGSRVSGRIHAIKVVADNDLTDNFDLTLTGETTEVPILVDATVSKNTTTWWYPRAIPSNNTDGSDFTNCVADIFTVRERIKAVLANAGTGVGTITVYYETSPY